MNRANVPKGAYCIERVGAPLGLSLQPYKVYKTVMTFQMSKNECPDSLHRYFATMPHISAYVARNFYDELLGVEIDSQLPFNKHAIKQTNKSLLLGG